MKHLAILLILAGLLAACGSATQPKDPRVEEDAIMNAVHAEIERTGDWSDLGCHMAEQRVRFLWSRGQWGKGGPK